MHLPARLHLIALGASLALLVPASVRAQLPAGSRAVESRHALPPDGNVRVWNLAGWVRVIGWEKDSVVVTGDVPLGVDFFCAGGERGVKCAANVPQSDAASAKPAHLEVHAPRGASIWVKSAGADIAIAGATGNVEAYSVTGAIRLEARARSVQLETMGGDIVAGGSAESLRARSASGAIDLSAAVEDADVSSVTGDVRVSGNIVRGRFESTEGTLHWNALPLPASRLELTSHAGAIEIMLPRGAGGVFAVNNYRGAVRCTVPGARRSENAATRETTFTLAPAREALISIRTFKGKVSIGRSEPRVTPRIRPSPAPR